MQPIFQTTQRNGSGFELTQTYYGPQIDLQELAGTSTVFGLPHYSLPQRNRVKVGTAPITKSANGLRSGSSFSNANIDGMTKVETQQRQVNTSTPLVSSPKSPCSNVISPTSPNSTNGATSRQAPFEKKFFRGIIKLNLSVPHIFLYSTFSGVC